MANSETVKNLVEVYFEDGQLWNGWVKIEEILVDLKCRGIEGNAAKQAIMGFWRANREEYNLITCSDMTRIGEGNHDKLPGDWPHIYWLIEKRNPA